jgi:hypothetical protein
VGAPPTNNYALNCGATTVARLTGALIDVESLLHLAVAIWRRVVVDRGAARRNGLAQHADDCVVQRSELLWAQPVRRGERMDLCAPERLIGVDVADPNDASLIEQEALDPCRAVRNERAKGVNGKRRCERLNAVVGEKRRRVWIKAGGGLTVTSLCNERHTTEGTNISEAKLTTVAQRE